MSVTYLPTSPAVLISIGGLNVSGSNIVFPNGDIDPWHALSVVHDLSPSLTAIYIHGTAHWSVALLTGWV